MDNMDNPNEELKSQEKAAVVALLNGMANLQDSLSTDQSCDPECNDREKDGFLFAADKLIEFSDSNPSLVKVSPRIIRDDDRKRLLPGQHAGVFVEFMSENGIKLNLNFWGGLRTLSSQDVRDGDTSLASSHARRTEKVLGQETHLNWQMTMTDGRVLESWVVFNPNNGGSLIQDMLQVDGQKLEGTPRIANADKRFNQLKSDVFNPISRLVQLVPSSA